MVDYRQQAITGVVPPASGDIWPRPAAVIARVPVSPLLTVAAMLEMVPMSIDRISPDAGMIGEGAAFAFCAARSVPVNGNFLAYAALSAERAITSCWVIFMWKGKKPSIARQPVNIAMAMSKYFPR